MNNQFPGPDEQAANGSQLHPDNFERSILIELHEIYTSEGGEFLDYAIRMNDESLRDTGIPENEISLYVPEPFNEPGDE